MITETNHSTTSHHSVNDVIKEENKQRYSSILNIKASQADSNIYTSIFRFRNLVSHHLFPICLSGSSITPQLPSKTKRQKPLSPKRSHPVLSPRSSSPFAHLPFHFHSSQPLSHFPIPYSSDPPPLSLSLSLTQIYSLHSRIPTRLLCKRHLHPHPTLLPLHRRRLPPLGGHRLHTKGPRPLQTMDPSHDPEHRTQDSK